VTVERKELRIELLLGTAVVDPSGRRVGRIQECRAHRNGDALVIEEFVIGVAGFLERLAASRLGSWISQAIGMRSPRPYVIPWHALDLSSPSRPRLQMSREQLGEGRRVRVSVSRRRRRPRTD